MIAYKLSSDIGSDIVFKDMISLANHLVKVKQTASFPLTIDMVFVPEERVFPQACRCEECEFCDDNWCDFHNTFVKKTDFCSFGKPMGD